MHHRLTREDEQRWKDLLIDSSEGNAQAYELLLREMYEYLDSFCKRRLYSHAQVDDCVQECLLAIHKAKHTFDPSKPFGPWFFTIVRHKIIDQFRKTKRLGDRERLNLDYEELPSQTTPGLDLAEELQKLLPQLPPLYREAFTLTKLENKTTAETARLLNIGESAVKVRVFRANKALRKLIKAEFARKY